MCLAELFPDETEEGEEDVVALPCGGGDDRREDCLCWGPVAFELLG